MLEEEINLYLAWKGTYAKDKTVTTYKSWVTKFNNNLSGKKIEEITLDDVINFNTFLKTNYAPKSVQIGMTVIRNFISFWKRRKSVNIILEDIRIVKTRSKSHKPITPEDYVLMLAGINHDTFAGQRDNVIVRMLYDTGMRIGELCALDVSNVNLDTQSAIAETEKTDKTRLVFWGKDTNEFLKYYLIARTEHAEEGETGLFVNLTGSRLTTRSSERIIQKYCNLAQISKKIVPHSFRHGKAHLILDSGGTVKDIQFILGHKSPISSFYYLDLSQAEQSKRALSFIR